MKKNSNGRFARFKLNTGAAVMLFALAAAIAIAAFIQSGGGSVQAQSQPLDTPTPAPEIDPDFPADFLMPDFSQLGSKKAPLGNLDSMLSQIVERVEQGVATADSAAADAPISRGESVAVTFYTQGDASTLADFLRVNGGDPRNVGEGYVEAYVPISLLVRASEQPGVVRVQAIMLPNPEDDAPLSLDSKGAALKGNVISQGVALHGADAWHDAGYTGEGVKVGIIDGGFAGFSALMGSELPANVTLRCYTDIGVFSSNFADCEAAAEGNHATIVAESLMDIAPDATLYISNPRSQGDLRQTVDWMVSQGVDVINRSQGGLWQGPGDGTSPSTVFTNNQFQAIDAAVAGGIMFTNSTGNYAQGTWYGQFNDPNGNKALNFAENAEFNTLGIADGQSITIQLRWDDSWTAADTDLDLELYLWDASERSWGLVARSILPQAGSANQVPLEYISGVIRVGGVHGIVVKHYAGDAPGWVQLQAFPSDLRYFSESRSINNPAESANPGMLAVGATHWWDTNTIAEYSSRGPAPDGRTKPDITGVACAQVAEGQVSEFYRGPAGQQCWFPGTSQASPHVAGLAALVKDAFPAYTPQQIASYLKTNAQARGAKPNNTWGHGFARLPAPPQTTTPPAATPSATPSPTPTGVPSPAPTPVGGAGDLAGRVSALEQQTGALQRLVQSLQSLIQALTNRVAALEQGGGGVAPVATPTATATATATPSPTPTTVPGTDPVPTPVGGGSDACVQPIEPGSTSGTWTTACLTANPPPDGRNYYAKFYTFTLDAAADVVITLSAAESTYLYLLEGAGMDGAVLRNVGDTASTTNTIATRLQPGSYTIEATTYNAEVTGAFTLDLTVTP